MTLISFTLILRFALIRVVEDYSDFPEVYRNLETLSLDLRTFKGWLLRAPTRLPEECFEESSFLAPLDDVFAAIDVFGQIGNHGDAPLANSQVDEAELSFEVALSALQRNCLGDCTGPDQQDRVCLL